MNFAEFKIETGPLLLGSAGSKTGNAYVLRSLLPSSIRENHVEAGNVQVEKGFTMVVFSLLSTNAGKISEGAKLTCLNDFYT